MAGRDYPYGAFAFMVQFDGRGSTDDILGGFSDVSGLGNEVKFSEYRNGNAKENHARKIANVNTTDDVTLKRGVLQDLRLYEWLAATRDGAYVPKTVTITLMDEAQNPVCDWTLHNAQPKKWVGPTLAAKGGGEVAMEELHLVAEEIKFTLHT